MVLEITGKFLKALPLANGTSDRGTWSKQSFILETLDSFPRKICAMAWNDRVNEVAGLKEGDTVKISFTVESREYNERWYTDIRATRIERLSAGSGANTLTPAGNTATPDFPTAPISEDPFLSQPTVDDLPF
jgi:hypothetical protein